VLDNLMASLTTELARRFESEGRLRFGFNMPQVCHCQAWFGSPNSK
jgi:hypothetical protein